MTEKLEAVGVIVIQAWSPREATYSRASGRFRVGTRIGVRLELTQGQLDELSEAARAGHFPLGTFCEVRLDHAV